MDLPRVASDVKRQPDTAPDTAAIGEQGDMGPICRGQMTLPQRAGAQCEALALAEGLLTETAFGLLSIQRSPLLIKAAGDRQIGAIMRS